MATRPSLSFCRDDPRSGCAEHCEEAALEDVPMVEDDTPAPYQGRWYKRLRDEYNAGWRAMTPMLASGRCLLWLGSRRAAAGVKGLRRNGIDARLSCLGKWGVRKDDHIVDMPHVPMDDILSGAKPLEHVLDWLLELDRQFVDLNKNVLVFCHQGCRRSASFLGCYFMCKTEQPAPLIFAYMKKLRAPIEDVVLQDLRHYQRCERLRGAFVWHCKLPRVVRKDEFLELYASRGEEARRRWRSVRFSEEEETPPRRSRSPGSTGETPRRPLRETERVWRKSSAAWSSASASSARSSEWQADYGVASTENEGEEQEEKHLKKQRPQGEESSQLQSLRDEVSALREEVSNLRGGRQGEELYRALSSGDVDAAKQLIAAKADVCYQDGDCDSRF